MKGVMTI